jgi:hypothetical protein
VNSPRRIPTVKFLLDDFCEMNKVFSFGKLVLLQNNSLRLLPILQGTSLLSFSSTTRVFKKTPARTPCGNSSNTSKYLNSSTLRTLCDNSLSTVSLRLQTLRLHSACALLARLLCLTCTSARMRTMLSLLSLQRRTLTSVNAHLADNFTALLAGKLLLRQRNN